MRSLNNPATSQFSGAKGTSPHLEQNGAKAVDVADDEEGLKLWNWGMTEAGKKWKQQTGASILYEGDHYHLEFNSPKINQAKVTASTSVPYRDVSEEQVATKQSAILKPVENKLPKILPGNSEIKTEVHPKYVEGKLEIERKPDLNLNPNYNFFELPKEIKRDTLTNLKTTINPPKEIVKQVDEVINKAIETGTVDDVPTDNKYMNWLKRGLVIVGAIQPFDTDSVPNQKKIEYKSESWLSSTANRSLQSNRTNKVVNYIPQTEEYEALGELNISGGKLHTFYHKFDRNQGAEYIPIKNVGHSDENTNYSGVKGIAHFILDTDVASDYQAKEGKVFVEKQLRGENITGGSTVQDQFVPIVTKHENKVIVKYKQVSELSKEDKVMSPLRQLRYSDLDWNNTTYTGDFKSSVQSVPVTHPYQGKTKYKSGTLNSSHFIFPKGNKAAYGKFGGGSVVFLSPKKNFAIDFAGSVLDIQKMAEQIISKEGLSKDDLIIAYHDLGSFSAKPKAEKGILKFNQWSGFNNEAYTGGGLAFPE